MGEDRVRVFFHRLLSPDIETSGIDYACALCKTHTPGNKTNADVAAAALKPLDSPAGF